jgi:choline-sulfatase
MTAPNVLIIMSDQHSKHYLGCYGNALVRTPHLDRLAAAGMVMDNCYTASPLCVPSRMSFMTTRYPSANRVWSNNHILSSAIPTWAHAMGAAGYETALIGRMHFVGPDQRHGFERRPLGEYSAVFPGATPLGAKQFQQIPVDTSGQTRIAVELAGVGRTSYQAFDEMVADAACDYLQEKSQTAAARPFAAVASFVLPHCPFVAPRELFDYYYDRVDVPQPTAAEVACEPEAVTQFKRSRGLEEPLPAERIRVARAAYFALCEYFDAQVGKVLEKLDETGLSDNTLVVYCSDHGEMAGEHGCWWKSNYYEGSVGVPLMARLPGVVPAGKGDPAICNLVDLGATMIEMADASPLPVSAGQSLWKVWQGEADPRRSDETFSEHGAQRDPAPSRMIRRGPWKLYKYHDDSAPVLYNLDEDADEMNDLGSDAASAQIRDTLLERLYHDWDPEGVVVESKRLDRDLETLTAWGRAVQPRHEDALPIPDVEDVELR